MIVCKASSHPQTEGFLYVQNMFYKLIITFLLVVPILSFKKKKRYMFFNPIAMLSTKCPLPLL